jgi:hypothetical protein
MLLRLFSAPRPRRCADPTLSRPPLRVILAGEFALGSPRALSRSRSARRESVQVCNPRAGPPPAAHTAVRAWVFRLLASLRAHPRSTAARSAPSVSAICTIRCRGGTSQRAPRTPWSGHGPAEARAGPGSPLVPHLDGHGLGERPEFPVAACRLSGSNVPHLRPRVHLEATHFRAQTLVGLRPSPTRRACFRLMWVKGAPARAGR